MSLCRLSTLLTVCSSCSAAHNNRSIPLRNPVLPPFSQLAIKHHTSSTHSLIPTPPPPDSFSLWVLPSYNTQLIYYNPSTTPPPTAAPPPSAPSHPCLQRRSVKIQSVCQHQHCHASGQPGHEPNMQHSYALACLLGLRRGRFKGVTSSTSPSATSPLSRPLPVPRRGDVDSEIELGRFGNGEVQMTTAVRSAAGNNHYPVLAIPT
ncbi:hypothetical protein B0H34DRAFT_717749 [Crassisporium funariophilum]|nr:hypothetical protein B0H34DRAFT_717749 [Crassisporium funariophilum]